jgi:hypothetical protein
MNYLCLTKVKYKQKEKTMMTMMIIKKAIASIKIKKLSEWELFV